MPFCFFLFFSLTIVLLCYLFYRSDLIDEGIEKAVATMQSVIELGRYIRDARVMPVKVHVSLAVRQSLVNRGVW